MRAAVAVELVHSATLVHDDLIDGASLRRGQPTVAAGRRARSAADGHRGPAVLARLRRAGAATRTSTQLQRALATPARRSPRASCCSARTPTPTHVAVERYLRRCELKTAALFEAACRLGALASRERSPGSPTRSAPSRGASGWPSRCSTTCSTSPGRSSGPARRAGTDLLDGTVTLPLDPRPRARGGARRRRPARPRRAPSRPRRCASGSPPRAPSSEARERALARGRRGEGGAARASCRTGARCCSTWSPTPSSSATAERLEVATA